MAAIELTYRATEYDLLNRTTRQVVLIGEASYTGLGIGGGPIVPPPGDKPPRPPVGIWPGPGDPDYGPGPHPSHPISLPGDPWWPKPPETVPPIPPPGSPPVVIKGDSPVNPIVPPPAIIVTYPGVGKVLVPLPAAPPA